MFRLLGLGLGFVGLSIHFFVGESVDILRQRFLERDPVVAQLNAAVVTQAMLVGYLLLPIALGFVVVGDGWVVFFLAGDCVIG